MLLSASGVGFYGARGDEPLDEAAALGEGFFPAVCRDWEAACAPARAAGMRVVNLRTGDVTRSGTEIRTCVNSPDGDVTIDL